MFWGFQDGKAIDPRDIEETPDMYAPPPEPSVKFGAVEKQDQVRPCYICGRACPEYAEFSSPGTKGDVLTYQMFLHKWCWYYQGGGLEAEKLSRSGR